MQQKVSKILPYGIAIIVFIAISIAYFPSILKGKTIYQSDIVQFKGMSKEISDFRTNNNTEPYWTNSAFSGMPAYNLSAKYPNSYIKKVDQLLRFLPRPADYVFLYLLTFFILLMVIKVDWKLAIVGSLAFGFSTYYIIILGVGHNAKAHAIAYMPLVLAGILLVLQRKKYFYGFILTAVALALEINASHPQMTYYLLFSVIALGIFFFLAALKKKHTSSFFKEIAVLSVAAVIAVGVNATSLLATKEYAAYSTRGKSELTITPDGKEKLASKGLSHEYITEYSYGITELFNLFIPRFMGGGSSENIGTDSNTYHFLKTKVDAMQAKGFSEHAPMYWGEQPIVEAPAYIGAVVIFLFVLALFMVKGRIKKWLIATVIIGILLSLGKNSSFLTNLLIDYMPLYNKFRAVSSAQVIVELAIPLLAILGLQAFFASENRKENNLKALKNAFYITGGIAIIFTVLGTGIFTFESPNDGYYAKMLDGLLSAIISDRKELFFNDSLRTFILVTITAGILFLYTKNKLSKNATIVTIAILILFDLGQVDKRYVNADDFVNTKQMKRPFTPSEIDKAILKDTSYYRVVNFSGNPMNEGRTSYFHKSIGGYHAAKMGRYQELFDYQIAKNNMNVLHMLNTKYIIFSDKNGQEQVQLNDKVLGNAWLVSQLKIAQNANQEMQLLDSLAIKNEAIIQKKYSKQLAHTYPKDSTATIQLTTYATNQLTYTSNSAHNAFAIFSEIYYPGWKAYIDGELQPHYQVNYVLRGMPIPKGTHTIEFIFEPDVIKYGNTITLVSYALLLIIPLGWFFVKKRGQQK